MELRVEIARRLPCELQDIIWKNYYNDKHVLPNLMSKVEAQLCNTEYESLLDDLSVLVSKVIEGLLQLKNSSEHAFDIAIDYAFDRLLECRSPCLDKVMLLHVIKDNIDNPYLLKITIENTEMIEAYRCSKCTQVYVLMETLQNVYDIIMPQGYDYLQEDNLYI